MFDRRISLSFNEIWTSGMIFAEHLDGYCRGLVLGSVTLLNGLTGADYLNFPQTTIGDLLYHIPLY